jgi:hypothetical protein
MELKLNNLWYYNPWLIASFEPLSVHINRKTKEKPIAFPPKQFQNKKVI